MKHEFNGEGGLLYLDLCVICNRIAGIIYEQATITQLGTKIIPKETWIDFMNEFAPCLSDEEYIIKQIIE